MIFYQPDDVVDYGNDDDNVHQGFPRSLLHNRRVDKNQRFKNFFTFWVYFFYEPDGIGNMTKVMIMIILIIIMIMLIFLQAKVFQVALKVGLLLVDLTHFTQI